MKEVLDCKFGLRIEERGEWRDFTPPKGYSLFEFGDGAITRIALRLCREAGKSFYRLKEKHRSFWRVDGYYLPDEIAVRAECIVAEKRVDKETWRRKREAEKDRRQKRDIELFIVAVKEQYPSIPEEDAVRVTRRACVVGSGRVGRSSTLPKEESVSLAVWAYVRHRYTDYDELLEKLLAKCFDREDREDTRAEVRDMVRPQIVKKVEEWMKG